MRTAIISLLTLAVVALPGSVDARSHHHHGHDLHVSQDSDFRFDGDLLVIAHRDGGQEDEVTVSKDGRLTINGSGIETDGKSRKLLKKFHAEAVKLDRQAGDIAKDAEGLSSEAAGFAVMTVAAVLESLTGEDHHAEAKADDWENDFEAKIALIEDKADEISETADKIEGLADELCDRVPELDDLGWFLDN